MARFIISFLPNFSVGRKRTMFEAVLVLAGNFLYAWDMYLWAPVKVRYSFSSILYRFNPPENPEKVYNFSITVCVILELFRFHIGQGGSLVKG